MDAYLEKIDLIRERAGVSYKVAKDALDQAGGNVVDALIMLEEKNEKGWTDSMGVMGNDIIEKLKKIISKGNVTRVILKKDGDVMLNIPITAGAIGVVLAPFVSIIGVSAAIASKASIEIVKDNGEVVDINDMAEEKMNIVKDKLAGKKSNKDIADDIESIIDDIDKGADY